MIKKQIRFGTDGWRGVIGEDFTEENVARVAKAFVQYLVQSNPSAVQLKVAVGYDGRKDSKNFASLFANVLAKNKLKVLLSSGVVPTPVLSFATKRNGCTAGVMVTAGHNPPQYNGLKFKAAYGGPFMSEETKKIEALLTDSDKEMGEAATTEMIDVIDFLPSYLSHLETIIDFSALTSFADNPRNTASAMIDSMGGAGQTILEDVLVGCGWRAQTLFGEPVPTFFDRSPEPISKNLEPLEYNVSETDAQLGIGLDGDADRCGIVYDNGEWMNAQETILALLWHLHEQKGWRGGIVKTASVTDKVRLLAEEWKAPLFDVDVGFKYVTEVMLKEQCMFGGEESGGFGYGKHLPERDGILSGLFFAEMIAMSGVSLREIARQVRDKVGELHYERIDVRCETLEGRDLLHRLLKSSPKKFSSYAIKDIRAYEVFGVLTGIKFCCGDCRWLLIRVSQTEPMVRLYAEGRSDEEVASLLDGGKKLIRV